MAYSGTSTVGTAYTPPAGQALPAGCGTNCASFPTPCPTLPPCYVYRCERQAFGACSLTCSPNGQPGTQVAGATCMRYNGVVGSGVGTQVSSTFCQTTAGRGEVTSTCAAQTQQCNVPPCITYRCVTGATSSCVATCGTPSTQFTVRTCMAYSGTSTVGTAYTPPAGQALPAGCGTSCASFPTPCPALPPCITYQCQIGALSACSVTCGQGVQTRSVQCISTSYASVGAPATTNSVNLSLCSNCAAQPAQACVLCPTTTRTIVIPPPPPPPPAPVVFDPCAGQPAGAILAVPSSANMAILLGLTGASAVTEGPSSAFGSFCGYFGLNNGLVLTTGDISQMSTPYKTTGQNGEDHAPAGVTGDKAVLTLTFTTTSTQTVSFRYILASQEMPKYFGTQYNDDAKILLDGNNIAKLPSGDDLTINNIGCQGGINDACKTDSSKWISQYVPNQPAKAGTPASMSGYLQTMTASGSVGAGQHTLQILVEDIGDGKYNTAIFVEGGSLRLGARRSGKSEALSQVESLRAEPTQRKESTSALLPVLAACSGFIVLSALLATTWMVADARARKAARTEISLCESNDMGVQTE